MVLDDISHARIAAGTGKTATPVDLLIHDFEVRYQGAPAAVAAPAPAGDANVLPRAESRGWLAAGSILGLLVVLSAVLGL